MKWSVRCTRYRKTLGLKCVYKMTILTAHRIRFIDDNHVFFVMIDFWMEKLSVHSAAATDERRERKLFVKSTKQIHTHTDFGLLAVGVSSQYFLLLSSLFYTFFFGCEHVRRYVCISPDKFAVIEKLLRCLVVISWF